MGARLAAIGAEQQIVLDRQAAQHAELQHQRHAARGDRIGRQPVDAGVFERDASGLSGKKPDDRAQERALSGGVAADQRHEFARLDLEIDVAQHDQVAIAGA